jgi:hypothetical protein
MAVPAGPQIKLSDVAAEFSDTAPFQMSEFYRGGAKVPNVPGNAAVATSGALGLQSFKGTQNRSTLALTIPASTQNYDVFTNANPSPNYTAGLTDLTLTIPAPVIVGSSSTGTYALSVPNGFTSGDTVTIVNNGVVQGRGGNGGNQPTGGGGTGGNAVYINFATTFTNNGTLAGGGGGGGGGNYRTVQRRINVTPKQPGEIQPYQLPGGGGGGGAGNNAGSGGAPNGGSGSSTAGGAGGPGGSGFIINPKGPTAGTPVPGYPGGPGGGRGANGVAAPAGQGGAGGTRGYYLVGNPLVTYPATGTRQGLVS